MWKLILLAFIVQSGKTIQIPYLDKEPVIDGYLEDVWKKAAKVDDFVQYMPSDTGSASLSTTVYIFQNRDNIFVAFICEDTEKPLTRVTSRDDAEGDRVSVAFDTFNNDRTAYLFMVSAGGAQEDVFIAEDGKRWDDSWDGVWYSGVYVSDSGYVVEMKIPFKTMRYGRELPEWGVSFSRFISRLNELDTWTRFTREEEIRVSRFGVLQGLKLPPPGMHLEFTPVAILRYDSLMDVTGGADLKWEPTSELTFNVTVRPDFAQIEADPYELNLGKYETYYPERRPFFIEGSDVFKFSSHSRNFNMGYGINLFYTRRIGKALENGEVVPIDFGIKGILHKTKFEGGFLFVRTEELIDEEDSIFEPLCNYSALRFRGEVFRNSTFGFIYAGKYDRDFHNLNSSLGLDFNYNKGTNDARIYLARSFKEDTSGNAFKITFSRMDRTYFIGLDYTRIDSSFNVEEIGYTPWTGVESFAIFAGPIWIRDKGVVSSSFLGFGAGRSIEMYEGVPETGFSVNFSQSFRSGDGYNINFYMGKSYEEETHYISKSFHLNFWTSERRKISGHIGGGFWYGYNYDREYFANQASISTHISYSPSSRMRLSVSNRNWIEFKPSGALEEITSSLRPRIRYSITNNLNLRFYSEHVYLKTEKEFYSHRIGFLLSYNFRPKSWIYFAVNKYWERNEETGLMESKEAVSVFKIRYLFMF